MTPISTPKYILCATPAPAPTPTSENFVFVTPTPTPAESGLGVHCSSLLNIYYLRKKKFEDENVHFVLLCEID